MTEPTLGWDDLIEGYWLRGFELSLPARSSTQLSPTSSGERRLSLTKPRNAG